MIDEKVMVLMFYLFFGLLYLAIKYTFKVLFLLVKSVRFVLKMIIQKKKIVI
ncbi:hypothetical protein [Enterococcus sp. AZ126]|uniref:hypothetical protein n=1 Tax=Enterococcus sp. AZ126 TaxID=2774635 RepID=UPI003F219C74